MRHLLAAATLLIALAAAAPAHAAFVSGTLDFHDYHGVPTGYEEKIVFDAADGESNRLDVSFDAATGYTFFDHGAPVNAGPGCHQVDAQTVSCTEQEGAQPQMGELGDYQGITRVEVDLGDEDDIAVAGPPEQYVEALVNGGKGDDVINTSGALPAYAFGDSGDDTLNGGVGDDLLVGGTGHDTLRGGAGTDVLGDDGHERDAYDGGPGGDTVSYQSARRPVRIDLVNGGSDGDSYTGIENATGGHEADTILGDGGRNTLYGGPGGDRMNARGGADYLEGEDGRDSVNGGAGEDFLVASDGRAEGVACGGGPDFVSTRDRNDALAPDCERTRVIGPNSYGTELVVQPLELGARMLGGIGLRCSTQKRTTGCVAKFTVRAGIERQAPVLGTASARADRGILVRVPVGLRDQVARALPAGEQVPIAIDVTLKVRRLNGGGAYAERDRVVTFVHR